MIRSNNDPIFYLQRVVSKADTNNDGLMDFSEFVSYCAEHEKKLWLVFNDLDINKDGILSI